MPQSLIRSGPNSDGRDLASHNFRIAFVAIFVLVLVMPRRVVMPLISADCCGEAAVNVATRQLRDMGPYPRLGYTNASVQFPAIRTALR
jgi:hypothetical protein